MGRPNIVLGDIVSTTERFFMCVIHMSLRENVRRIKLRASSCDTSVRLLNFMIVTDPNDFALITGLYRSSVDGRRYMYEAIMSDDGKYNIPDNFTSRTSQVLQVYLKSLGVSMKTVLDEDDFIGEKEHSEEIVGYEVGGFTIFCTINEMYYLKKMHKVYRRYLKEHPNSIDDIDDVWEYMMDNLPFKKKLLTENIVRMFKDNIEAFAH